MVSMKPQKEKDALTDLVEISASDASDQTTNEGEVTDATGDKVTLDFKVLARKLLNTVRIRKEEDRKVKEYLDSKK